VSSGFPGGREIAGRLPGRGAGGVGARSRSGGLVCRPKDSLFIGGAERASSSELPALAAITARQIGRARGFGIGKASARGDGNASARGSCAADWREGQTAPFSRLTSSGTSFIRSACQ